MDALDVGAGGSLSRSTRRTTPPEVFLLRPPVGRGGRPGSVGLATLPHFRSVWRARGAPWSWGMLGTHGEKPQGALAEPCASARGGAARRAPKARKRGPGAGFRAARGGLAETKLSNQHGERHRPWLGRGRGACPLTRLVDRGSLSPSAASARAVCWFPFIGPQAAPGFPSFVARK